jgi:hypothetical protein
MKVLALNLNIFVSIIQSQRTCVIGYEMHTPRVSIDGLESQLFLLAVCL